MENFLNIVVVINAVILLVVLVIVLRIKSIKSDKNGVEKSDLTMITDFLDKTLGLNNKSMQDQLATLQRQVNQEQTTLQQAQTQLRLELTKVIETLTATNDTKFETMRKTMIDALQNIQKDNAEKLEKMRETVDEKLNKTLEDRLTQKFQLISSQFETVQKGFGEMQSLVTGVDELKKALGNVKTRGIMGEIQLGRILKEMLSPDLFFEQVPTKPGSSDPVDFAVKLPGDNQQPILLPIDAKFPLEDYYRLLEAYDKADKVLVEAALEALEKNIDGMAKSIASKYIEVPYTTNFAILFLPVEGLYAEAIRRGLVDRLQTKYNVVIAGPTTMAALLNSLQIGFKTLKIQKKSQEVWQVLSKAKKEFDEFAKVLAKTQEKITEAGAELDKLIGTRTRMIQSKLRALETDAPLIEDKDSKEE